MVGKHSRPVTVACPNHSDILIDGLWNRFQTNRGTDFELRWSGRTIGVHSLVAEVFLPPKTLERNLQSDCADFSVDSLLEFLYRGRATLPDGQLENLLGLAKELDFRLLVDAVERARDSDGTDCSADINCRNGVRGSRAKSHREVKRGKISKWTPRRRKCSDMGEKVVGKSETVSLDVAVTTCTSSKDEEAFTLPATVTVEQSCTGDEVPLEQAVIDGQPNEDSATICPGDSEPAAKTSDSVGSAPEEPCSVSDSASCSSDWKAGSRCRRKRKARSSGGGGSRVCSKNGRYQRRMLPPAENGRPDADGSVKVETVKVPAVRKHNCPDCPFACARLSDLKVHATALHSGGVKPFKCGQCDFASSRKSQVNSHVRGAHLNIRPCLCDQCGYRTISKSRLERHKMRHSEVKAYVCAVCGEAYRYHASLWRHSKRHEENDAKPFMCHLCGHASREKHSLKIHLENAHKSTFKCRLCDFWCSSCVGLGQHRKTAHPNTKPFPCTECDYSCRSRSTLAEHYRKHTGEKPFRCHFCGKNFSQRGYFDIHVRKHELDNKPVESKRFACQECSSSFERRIDLRKHLRVHKSAHQSSSVGDKPKSVAEEAT